MRLDRLARFGDGSSFLKTQNPLNSQITELGNGVRVATCEMPHTESVSFGLWTGVGGRHEPARLSGISHFIEHMLFKGTRRRTARQIGQEIESVGGYLNATTTHDHTVYFGAAPSDQFKRLSGVLCDMYSDPRFAEADIRKERGVIAEEIQMYQDEPSELVQELLWEELWPGHGLGRPLTGTLGSIAKLGRDDFLAYRGRHYSGRNTVVSATGRIEHARVVDRVAALLGDFPSGKRSHARSAPPLPPKPRLRIERRETQQTHVALAVPACDLFDPDRYTVAILNVLLGGNMSSRLFQELRERRGICYSVSSNISHYEDTGVINFYVGLDDRNLPRSLAIIAREFARLRDEPVRPSELARAKAYAVGASRMAMERTSTQNSRIGYSTLFYGKICPHEQVHHRLLEVTSEDILRVARQRLLPESVTMTVVGPIPESEDLLSHLR